MQPNRWLDHSYLARYIFLNAVDISDYRSFPARTIDNAPPIFNFQPSDQDSGLLSDAKGLVPHPLRNADETLDRFLLRNGTVAFLVIHRDRLLLERYYGGYNRSSVVTSFSTVKSFVSALIGIAAHDGLIERLDDPLNRYLPELAAPHWSPITIRHLVSMTSGLRYHANSFLPWDDDPRIYYTPDIRRLAREARRAEAPGQHFQYNNYNLVLLGMLLERITGGTVSAYLQEKIWMPLGMELPASWSLDSTRCGMEKMESGLNARAIDFAKFGRLYLRRGDWDGRQLIPESWVAELTIVAPDAPWANYKYLWWIPRSGKGRFMAVGNLGQFIYVAPDRECIILRFGRAKPANWQRVYPQLFASLADRL